MTLGVLASLPTPALVLDRLRLEANASAMRARMSSLGLGLRPHVKTVKSVDAARVAVGAERGPITVSTLREAEHFADFGFDDILYAVCISPDKIERAGRLARKGVRLGLITDDLLVAEALASWKAPTGVTLDVLIELDVGEHRTGVDPEGDALVRIAHRVHEAAHLRLRGVLSHAGHAYRCSSVAEIVAVADDERRLSAHAAERLRDASLPCDVVSVGSTPTAVHARSGSGLTEMRPGVYLLGDLFQAAVGTCTWNDIAVSVLATVISHHADGSGFVLDAGALAMSKDRSTADTRNDAGYGLLLDEHGEGPLPGLQLVDVHQEHGEARGTGPIDLTLHPVGSRVRVLPNHACMTAAMFDRYHVVEGHEPGIVAIWERVNGW